MVLCAFRRGERKEEKLVTNLAMNLALLKKQKAIMRRHIYRRGEMSCIYTDEV